MQFTAPTDEQIRRLRMQSSWPKVQVVIADDQDELHEMSLYAADPEAAAEKVLRGLDIVGYRGLRVISCLVCLD